MSVQKIVMISLIIFSIILVSTVGIFALKPKMHKTIMLEQIIYKRTK